MVHFHERRLPHYYSVGQPMFLTWRLYGSLPDSRTFPVALSNGQAFRAMDSLLDRASSGPLFLRTDEIARMMVDALHYHDRALKHYQLHRYVVMANHVHALVTPQAPPWKVLHSLKRFTAREANQILGRTGEPFWQHESYDRLVRDAEEFQRIASYIDKNPVRAGLVASPEEYRWSSAYEEAYVHAHVGPVANRQPVVNRLKREN